MPVLRDPATALGVTALAAAVRMTEVGPPVQPLVLAMFLLIGPGAACLGNPASWPSTVWWTAVLATSISISTLVSTTLLYAGVWSPDRVFLVLLVGSVLGAALHLRARRGSLTRRTA